MVVPVVPSRNGMAVLLVSAICYSEGYDIFAISIVVPATGMATMAHYLHFRFIFVY